MLIIKHLKRIFQQKPALTPDQYKAIADSIVSPVRESSNATIEERINEAYDLLGEAAGTIRYCQIRGYDDMSYDSLLKATEAADRSYTEFEKGQYSQGSESVRECVFYLRDYINALRQRDSQSVDSRIGRQYGLQSTVETIFDGLKRLENANLGSLFNINEIASRSSLLPYSVAVDIDRISYAGIQKAKRITS